MIASIQIAPAVRAIQASAAASQSSQTSATPNFGSVLGQYHSPSEAESENAGNPQSGPHSQQDSSSTSLAATQNPAKTNRELAGSSQDQKTSATSASIDTDNDTGNDTSGEISDEASGAAKFRGMLSRIRSLRALDAADAQSAPAQKPASATETAMAPFSAAHTAEPIHLKLPFSSSLTLKQSGSAAQNTSAAATDAAPELETEAPVPFAPPQVQNEVTATSAGSLAFAARLNPGTETQSSASNAPSTLPQQQVQTPVDAAARAATKQAIATSDSPSDAHPDAHSGGGGFQSPQQNTSELFAKPEAPMAPTPLAANPSAPASTDKPSGPVPAAAQMDRVADPPAAPSNTNHDVTIRIPDASDSGMAVRFVERAGEVYVSVRTSDTEMAQTLRGGLSDLVTSLQDGGIRTEVWQPGSDASSSQGDPQHAFTNPDGSNGNSSSSGSNSEQEASQQNKPRWVEEMENSIGNFKETSQLWQA